MRQLGHGELKLGSGNGGHGDHGDGAKALGLYLGPNGDASGSGR